MIVYFWVGLELNKGLELGGYNGGLMELRELGP